MKVLVTGIDGFTGRYAKAELEAAGHQAFGLQANLLDGQALTDELADVRPDAVLHLAAVAFVGHADADAFYNVNLLGTRHLLEALAPIAEDLKTVLLASSANIYGNRSEGALDEDTVPSPANDYAVSKLAMEQMASLWQDRLPLVITRPFNYTGVGQADNFLIPKIVSHFARRAEVIELGNTEVFREFGDVRRVVQIYRQLLEMSPQGETVNVCNGVPHSLRDVIGLCERLTGHSIKIEVNPAFARPNEVRTLIGDPSRLNALLGDDQPAADLENTLRWMLDASA